MRRSATGAGRATSPGEETSTAAYPPQGRASAEGASAWRAVEGFLQEIAMDRRKLSTQNIPKEFPKMNSLKSRSSCSKVK